MSRNSDLVRLIIVLFLDQVRVQVHGRHPLAALLLGLYSGLPPLPHQGQDHPSGGTDGAVPFLTRDPVQMVEEFGTVGQTFQGAQDIPELFRRVPGLKVKPVVVKSGIEGPASGNLAGPGQELQGLGRVVEMDLGQVQEEPLALCRIADGLEALDQDRMHGLHEAGGPGRLQLLSQNPSADLQSLVEAEGSEVVVEETFLDLQHVGMLLGQLLEDVPGVVELLQGHQLHALLDPGTQRGVAGAPEGELIVFRAQRSPGRRGRVRSRLRLLRRSFFAEFPGILCRKGGGLLMRHLDGMSGAFRDVRDGLLNHRFDQVRRDLFRRGCSDRWCFDRRLRQGFGGLRPV